MAVARLMHRTQPQAIPVQRVQHTYAKSTNKWQADDTTDASGEPDMFALPEDIKFPAEALVNGAVFDQATGMLTIPGESPRHLFDIIGSAASRTGKKKKKPTLGDWHTERRPTAYGFLLGAGTQGPHTISHVTKKASAHSSRRANKKFQPAGLLDQKSITFPSAAQHRANVRKYEQATGRQLDKKRKRALDTEWSGLRGKSRVSNVDMAKMFELNVLGTYSHGLKADDKQIGAKGENREDAFADLQEISRMRPGDSLPTGLQTYDYLALEELTGGPEAVKKYKELQARYVRSMATIARGATLSEYDGTSDPPYSETDEPNPKRRRTAEGEGDVQGSEESEEGEVSEQSSSESSEGKGKGKARARGSGAKRKRSAKAAEDRFEGPKKKARATTTTTTAGPRDDSDHGSGDVGHDQSAHRQDEEEESD